MNKKRIGLYSALLVIATLFLGVAYANIANINLDIIGNALLVSKENIEITDISYKEDLNADIEITKIISTAKTLMHSVVKLAKDKDAYITYTVTVKNNTSRDLYYIETVKNDDFYTNSDKKLNDQIIYEIVGINQYDRIRKDGGEVSFDIVFKYELESEEEIMDENTLLSSYLNFRFREVYNITYIGFTGNDYIDKLIEGEDYEIELITDDVEEKIIVSGDVTYSFDDNVISLKDIKSDITVIKEEAE